MAQSWKQHVAQAPKQGCAALHPGTQLTATGDRWGLDSSPQRPGGEHAHAREVGGGSAGLVVPVSLPHLERALSQDRRRDLQQAKSSSLQWMEGTHRLEEPVSKTTVKHCGGVPMPISP